MRNVSLKTSFLLLLLILFAANYGYSWCPWNVETNTEAEAGVSKVGSFFKWFVGQDGTFDDHLLKNIRVRMVRGQGVYGYFDPKIEVCNYKWGRCATLHSGVSCHHVYGTQHTGAGVSAHVFIDWDGTKTLIGSQGNTPGGLEWEWANGVGSDEQEKFKESPKICACAQKAACMSGIDAFAAKPIINFWDEVKINEYLDNQCDTCYKDKIKCAPIPLAQGPPPFCDQLESSPPQVRVVPINVNDNDYFDPKVKVIISELEEGKSLSFPKDIWNDKNKSVLPHRIEDKNTTHYFKTYRKKGELCAGYYGTQGTEEKDLQFTRCFPSPPAPQPEIENIVNGDQLKIKVKMSRGTCRNYGTYNNGFCTFDIDANRNINIGPLSLSVVKPTMTKKGQNGIDDVLDRILSNDKNEKFKALRKYGCVPDIEVRCSSNGSFYSLTEFAKGIKDKSIKCELDNNTQLRQQKTEVQYKKNVGSKGGKMLCISGYQPEPEEFVLERDREIIPLKSMGASYAKYVPVYSEESKHLYYLPLNETVDLLAQPQDKLDNIVFGKQGYIFIPKDENNKEKGLCIVQKDEEIDEKKGSNECKLVYKLIDSEYKEKCSAGDDGCICMNNKCNRSTQYVRKDKGEPFYLRILQEEQNGLVKPQEIPIKANRTEVFYADELCTFNLEGLMNDLKKAIMDQLKSELEKNKGNLAKVDRFESFDVQSVSYTDLSDYEYIEIEAWGGGEAGHIKGTPEKAYGEHSQKSRIGMPGDYIKAKLKVDSNYPFIKVQVTEGGGNQEDLIRKKDGGPTIIEVCDKSKSNCKTLITVAGGGTYKQYGFSTDPIKTAVHRDLEQGEMKKIEVATLKCTENKDKKVAYIKDGTIEYEDVGGCNAGDKSSIYGSGGCIDKNMGSYGKGAAGYAIIKCLKIPKIGEDDEQKIREAIEKLLGKQDNISETNQLFGNDSLIKKLDPNIVKTIRNKIIEKLGCK